MLPNRDTKPLLHPECDLKGIQGIEIEHCPNESLVVRHRIRFEQPRAGKLRGKVLELRPEDDLIWAPLLHAS